MPIPVHAYLFPLSYQQSAPIRHMGKGNFYPENDPRYPTTCYWGPNDVCARMVVNHLHNRHGHLVVCGHGSGTSTQIGTQNNHRSSMMIIHNIIAWCGGRTPINIYIWFKNCNSALVAGPMAADWAQRRGVNFLGIYGTEKIIHTEYNYEFWRLDWQHDWTRHGGTDERTPFDIIEEAKQEYLLG